jgi:hypothetical protein
MPPPASAASTNSVVHGTQHRDVFLEHVVEGRFRTGVLGADLAQYFVEQCGIFQHQKVRLEESRFGGTHGRGHLIPDFLDILSGAQQGDVEPFDLWVDGLGRDFLPRDLPTCLPHPQDAGVGHAIRNRDTAVGA